MTGMRDPAIISRVASLLVSGLYVNVQCRPQDQVFTVMLVESAREREPSLALSM
jgi:hypothetical protein